MRQSQTWLPILVSLSSSVSAFYPYQRQQNSVSTSDSNNGRTKRFYPVRPPTIATSDSSEGVVRLDIHKTRKQKRDNQFAVSLSNPATFGPNALAIDQDGSDYSYFSTMQFGSKGQDMYMLIDTGSANTWVFSSDCKSSTCSIHNTFGKEDSTTLKSTTEQWDLFYGTGEVSGNLATDTVSFANFSIEMGFGLATTASDDFNNYPMDGILGLGRKTSDKTGSATVMDELATNGLIQSKTIGVYLHRGEDNKKDGEIIFGGIDTNRFSGTLAYTRTTNDDSWEIPVEDFAVDGKAVGLKDRTAIIDTGTTFILLPPSDAQALHALIPGSASSGEGYTLPCNTNTKLEVRINGKTYGIPAKDYVGQPSQSGSSTCSSTIIGHQAFGERQWILGDVFLKNAYTVFDFDNKQIGFGMPGTGGSLPSSGSSSASATSTSTIASSSSGTSRASATSSNSASSSGSASSTSTSMDSAEGARNTAQPDSTVGNETSEGAAGRIVTGYWKVGFSICAGFWMGMGVF